MRVLFTGVTSFTGAWFAGALADRGHEVVAVLQGPEGSYDGLKAERLARFGGRCEFAWGAAFGTAAFHAVIGENGPFDLFCHHAADTRNYKSPEFDVTAALAGNTRALHQTLAILKEQGCRRVLLTGSVFEAHEGAGTEPLNAFSAYGLSKTFTSESFRFHADRDGLGLGKFVIANPFGPFEEPRFTNYLLHCWVSGKMAQVNTPRYVRDNIPVSLLALSYARFAEDFPEAGLTKINPSYYVETQGAFTRRFADEIGRRLKIDTPVKFAEQSDFSEPLIRINTDCVDGAAMGWCEQAAWDQLAAYYAGRFLLAEKAI